MYFGTLSQDLFFAGVILGRAYGCTGRPEFADMCCHLLLTNQNQREAGLYNHADHSPNAWSRGNGFAAAGYAEALGYLGREHSRYSELLDRHVRHINALATHQGEDGTWHQIVDDPTSFHELTSTGLIGYAISHGLAGGWLQRSCVLDRTVQRAITAVRSRIDTAGNVKGGCQSTGPLPSTAAYLAHPILDGVHDDRTGSVCFWFAVAHAQNPNRAAVEAASAAPPERGPPVQPLRRPRVAAIVTTCYPRSHGDVILTKLIKGMSLDSGFVQPRVDVVALWIDGIATTAPDVIVPLAKQHGVALYPSIRRALLHGSAGEGQLGDLDGVLVVGEHGDYPNSETGREMHPRRYNNHVTTTNNQLTIFMV
eukprot:SAG31_NODE_2622_length_5362_cov_2.274178_3_plen_367_part_00